MAIRFTRVTVVGGDGRRADVSLPAQQPVVTLVPQLCTLLSLPPSSGTAPWTLSTVRAGILEPGLSLDEAGIVDADVVFLAAPHEAPQAPYVDDVVDDLRAGVDAARTVGDGVEWAGAARAAGSCALGLAAAAAAARLDNPAATAAVLLLVGILGTGLGWALRTRGGAYLAAGGVPAWAVGGWAAGDAWSDRWPVLATAAAVGAGLGLASWGLLGRRWYGVAAAGGTLAVLAAATLAVAATGAAPERAAAVVAVLVLVALGLASRLALGASGLLPLVRTEERGGGVPRAALVQATRTGQLVLTGVVAGSAAAAAGAAVTLLLAGGVAAPVLGAVLGAACVLRSRTFSRLGQVLPLLAVGVAAAAAGLSGDWTGVPGLVAVALVVLVLGLGRVDEVAGARLRRLAGLAEVLAVVATVPLALAVFDAYRAVRDLVS